MIEDNVLIVIGVKVLGLIMIYVYFKIGVGLVVLNDVSENLMVVGIFGWVVI